MTRTPDHYDALTRGCLIVSIWIVILCMFLAGVSK